MKYFVIIGLVLTAIKLDSVVWVEKTHSDFADGWEYYYVDGDTSTVWDTNKLRIWDIGAYVYSPISGGLRIIGRDWDLDDNGWLDVILCDYSPNKADIYWNSGAGFSTTNFTALPMKAKDDSCYTRNELKRKTYLLYFLFRIYVY